MFLFNLFFFNFFGSHQEDFPPADVEITPFLGVDPLLRSKYEKSIDPSTNTFLCFDGKKRISMDQFNDNYRDCDDGSDEPGTAEGESLFYCKGDGYVPSFIPRWSVSDGICDCCDGSDEAFNNHTSCPNTCSHLEKKRKGIFQSVEDAFKKGNKKYHEMITEGKERTQNAKALFEEYNGKIDRLQKAKDAINRAQTRETPTPTPEPPDHFDENDWDSPVEEVEELIDDQVSAEKIQDNANQIPKQNEAAQENNENEKEDQNEEQEQEDEIDYEQNGKNCSQTIDKDFFYSFEFPFCIDDSENPYPKGLTNAEKQERRNKIDDTISRLRNEMNSKEPLIKYIEKNLPSELILLAGTEFNNDKYKYVFADRLTYSGSNYGNFKEYSDGKFYHDNGAYCWETHCGKKTVMRFSCWNENRLGYVFEASRCEYKAVFATPAVCTDDVLSRVYNMTYDELEQVRQDAGQ